MGGPTRSATSRANVTTPGRRGTGGAWTGCGAHCISTTARTYTVSTCASPACRRWASDTCSGRGSHSSIWRASRREKTFGDNDLPIGTTLELSPGGMTATIDVRGHAPVLLTSPDGRHQPLPAGLGDGDHHRRPHRSRLAGVEPQPVVIPLKSIALFVLAAVFEIGGRLAGVAGHPGAPRLAVGGRRGARARRLRLRRRVSARCALRSGAGRLRRGVRRRLVAVGHGRRRFPAGPVGRRRARWSACSASG